MNNTSPLGAFGVLPAELRNEIYAHALTSTETIEISRSRHENPAYYRQPQAAGQPRPPKCFYKSKGTIEVARGKQKPKRAVASMFALDLLRTSKAIHAEATPILYGQNDFQFDIGFAMEPFADSLAAKLALVSRVKFWVSETQPPSEQIARLSGMAKPERIRIDISAISTSEHPSASDAAGQVWQRIKPLLETQGVFAVYGWPKLVVDLPLELQLRRLSAVGFVQVPDYRFEAKVDGLVMCRHAQSGKKRVSMFKELIEDLLRRDAREAEALVEAKKKVVEEKMRAVGALK